MDVHVPFAVTAALKLRGIEVLTAQQDGCSEFDDVALLNRATELVRILVTQDDDLLRIGASWQAEGRRFAGIIYSHQLQITIGQLVKDIELIAALTATDEWMGRIEYLPL